jgi:hypothetical protein
LRGGQGLPAQVAGTLRRVPATDAGPTWSNTCSWVVSGPNTWSNATRASDLASRTELPSKVMHVSSPLRSRSKAFRGRARTSTWGLGSGGGTGRGQRECVNNLGPDRGQTLLGAGRGWPQGRERRNGAHAHSFATHARHAQGGCNTHPNIGLALCSWRRPTARPSPRAHPCPKGGPSRGAHHGSHGDGRRRGRERP